MTDNSWPNKGLIAYYYGDISHQDWLMMRQQLGTLGGSDLGVIMGLNKYESPKLLFLRRCGVAPPRLHADTLHTAFGKLLEPAVAAAWKCYDDDEEVHAKRIALLAEQRRLRDPMVASCRRYAYMLVHPDMPWMHATIDYRIQRIRHQTRSWLDHDVSDGILECKTVSHMVSDMYADGIPPYYRPQVFGYMAITGARYAEIAAIVGGNRLKVHPFVYEEHEEEIRAVVDHAAEFMAGVHKAMAALRQRYGEDAVFFDEVGLTPLGDEAVMVAEEHMPSWLDDRSDEYQRFLHARHQIQIDMKEERDDDDELAVMALRFMELASAVSEREQLRRSIREEMVRRGLTRFLSPSVRITYTNQLRINRNNNKKDEI